MQEVCLQCHKLTVDKDYVGKTEDKILGYPPYFAIVHDEKAELNFWAHRIDGVKALVARLCICAKPEWSRGQWGSPCLWLCSDSAI